MSLKDAIDRIKSPHHEEEAVDFELYADDEMVASASGPWAGAVKEILSYCSQYAYEAENVQIMQVTRRCVPAAELFKESLERAKKAIEESRE